MADRVQVREISNDEGQRLLKMVRRSSGSIVTWRRAQIVLWSAQQMDVPQIAALGFTSEDRAREVIHNFNADGFDSLYPRYAGGRPPKFDAEQRREIKQIALGRPTDYDLPFSTWSLSKLGEHLVAKGVVNDISHEGLRLLLREEGESFHVVNTFKRSNDPDYEAKKNRILHLYNLADGKIDRPHGVRRGLRLVDRPALRTHQEGPHPVPRVLPLPAHPAPAPCSDRDRARQLLTAPVDQEGPTRQRVGRGEQRRTRLHPVLRVNG